MIRAVLYGYHSHYQTTIIIDPMLPQIPLGRGDWAQPIEVVEACFSSVVVCVTSMEWNILASIQSLLLIVVPAMPILHIPASLLSLAIRMLLRSFFIRDRCNGTTRSYIEFLRHQRVFLFLKRISSAAAAYTLCTLCTHITETCRQCCPSSTWACSIIPTPSRRSWMHCGRH